MRSQSFTHHSSVVTHHLPVMHAHTHAIRGPLWQDLWRLDLTTWEWDCLPSKGGPSARSGHRMVLHKSRVLLFGGFYDTGRDVKWVAPRGSREGP